MKIKPSRRKRFSIDPKRCLCCDGRGWMWDRFGLHKHPCEYCYGTALT